MDITGGYEESVGIAGGFGQGGGVGDFTTTYGLMVDNAMEFEVVTADGQVRVINECNDPDLFWAMRGGGGGTYAVLTKYRVQVYPALPIHTYTFSATFSGDNATQKATLDKILTAHAENQLSWSAQLVTGSTDYYPSHISMGLVLPYNDNGTKLKSTIAAFVKTISNMSNITITNNTYIAFASYTDYLALSAADARKTEPAGISSLLSSRLMPRNLFKTPESINSLVEVVLYGIEKARTLLPLTATQIVYESPLSNPDTKHSTSAHPAWRDALWHVIHVGEWEEPLTPAVHEDAADGFLEMLEPLKALTPGGGAYFNEASWGRRSLEGIMRGWWRLRGGMIRVICLIVGSVLGGGGRMSELFLN
jgi:FAD/FMN-containing dehydrogenase